ncbi:hypothetical protein KEM55_007837 [Ascosphaera atra]|nr:hypothetical protein KEM55_007837 [Ascosphaera atra]
MSPTLLTLPLEILHLVATTLESDYKPGLLSFAATSRTCYAAANKLRFKKLYIRPHHSAHLASDIVQWTHILSRTDAFAYVRQLELDEPLTSNSGNGPGLLQDREGLTALLEFLPRLFMLEDLVHACRGPFPPELLRVLHECLPACRLRLMSFDLESPPPSTPERSRSASPELAESAEAPVIDSDKLALATSPSLHTIVVRNAMLRPMTVNEDMALHMAAGLAPNLKRVNILTWNYDRTPVRLAHVAEESGHGEMLRRVLGGDLSQNGNGNPGASYLEGLSLPSIQLDQFLEWERRVDFSRLQTLRLWSATPAMLTRAAECTFASLRTLRNKREWRSMG